MTTIEDIALSKALAEAHRKHTEALYNEFEAIINAHEDWRDGAFSAVLGAILSTKLVTPTEIEDSLGIGPLRQENWLRGRGYEPSGVIAKTLAGLLLLLMREKIPTSFSEMDMEAAKWLNRPIDDLDLPVNTTRLLHNGNIDLVHVLTLKTKDDLLRLPNFGRKALKRVEEALSAKGLKLAEPS